MKLKEYAIIALALFLAGWLATEKIKRARDNRKHEAAKAELRAQVQRLTDAKQETIIKYDTIIRTVYRVRRVLVPIDSVRVDTVFMAWRREYSDTLQTVDFSLPYRIGVEGRLDFIDFDTYKLFTQKEIVNHIVEKPVIKYNEKSHLYAYAMFGNTGKEWTAWESLDVGLQWVHKRGIVLGGGVQWFDGGRFYKLKIGYRLTR